MALAIGWTALVAVHWTLFEEPRWLLLAHTLAYALVVGYWCITMMFLIYMRRRRPDWFGG